MSSKEDRVREVLLRPPLDLAAIPRALDLVAIAESDRLAAQALHGARLFPQAVFSLQQSIEKTVKAIGIAARMITVDELHGAISHRSFNVFVFGIRRILAFAQEHPTLPPADPVIEILQQTEAERDRFNSTARPTSEDLTKWIADYRAFAARIVGLLDPQNAATAAALAKAVNDAGPGPGPLPFDNAQLGQRILEGLSVVSGLYFLCLATLAHAVVSRYGEHGRSPIDIYGPAHPLVAHMPDLIAIAGECIGFTQAAFFLASKHLA